MESLFKGLPSPKNSFQAPPTTHPVRELTADAVKKIETSNTE